MDSNINFYEFHLNAWGSEIIVEICRVIYQVKVKERNRAVLSGYVDVHRLTSAL